MNPVLAVLPSATCRSWSYARAEYRTEDAERRVLVWQVSTRSGGTCGAVSVRAEGGAADLPGTRTPMDCDELLAFLAQIEATGRVTVGDDEIVFAPDMRVAFLRNARASLDEVRSQAA